MRCWASSPTKPWPGAWAAQSKRSKPGGNGWEYLHPGWNEILTETTFFAKGGPVAMTITFVPKPDGKVSEAAFSLMGLREFRLHRLP